MPKDSRTYSETEVRQFFVDAFRKEGREVDMIAINYGRPTHWTPMDPGNGLTTTVYFK